MRVLRETLILLVCTLVAAGATHVFHPRAPVWYLIEEPVGDDEVTLEVVQEKWKGDVLWIDARPRDQYDKAHIPGALLLNEQEADTLMFQHFEKLQDNTKPVVVYCDGAACQASRKMREYLKERLAIEEIYILRGGWKAWQEKK